MRATIVAAVAMISALALLALVPVVPESALAQESAPELVLYEPPVLTQVVDPFRPPASFAGPGNRGLEYGNAGGRVVASAAAGLVTFAGPVAGRSAITIEHADGVRTTYTGLREIWVEQWQYLRQGATIAIAESGFHFGARIRDRYLDPQILLDASQADTRARLIAPPEG